MTTLIQLIPFSLQIFILIVTISILLNGTGKLIIEFLGSICSLTQEKVNILKEVTYCGINPSMSLYLTLQLLNVESNLLISLQLLMALILIEIVAIALSYFEWKAMTAESVMS